MNNKFSKLVTSTPIIPVVSAKTTDLALKTVEATLKGGMSSVEVVLRSAAALSTISAIRKEFPEVTVGAGTLKTPQHVTHSVAAGAQFLVSPGTGPHLMQAMKATKLPMLPGVISPSEIISALEQDVTELKFFPAEQAGGPAMLKAYSNVFPEVTFCPTGGINLNNLQSYLSLHNVLAVGGTWMVASDLIESQKWSQIETMSQQAILLAKEYKISH